MKKKIVISLTLIVAFALTAVFLPMLNMNTDVSANSSWQYLTGNLGQKSSVISDEQVSLADDTIYSTASLDDNFTDDVVLISMSRIASRNFRDLKVADFPEVRLASVRDITPGFELAQSQIQASKSRRESSFYYEPSWTVDLDNFRRILVLTLANPSRENVLRAVYVLQQRLEIHMAGLDRLETGGI